VIGHQELPPLPPPGWSQGGGVPEGNDLRASVSCTGSVRPPTPSPFLQEAPGEKGPRSHFLPLSSSRVISEGGLPVPPPGSVDVLQVLQEDTETNI